MTSPTLFYDLAAEALAVAVDALDATLPAPHRHDTAAVVNGPPALDEWEGCATMVTAWAEAVTPTTSPPEPATGVTLCTPPWPMVQVAVQTVRCEPTIGDDATLPSAEELDNAARLVAVDAFTVWNALAQWAVRLSAGVDAEDDFRDWQAAMGLATPVEPQGGLAGWTTRIVVVPTDPSCPVASLPDLPDGFLPTANSGGW